MKIGFIGAGNMASAIIGGILKADIVDKRDILAYDVLPKALDKAVERFGIAIAESNHAVAAASDVLFLAVKPQYCEGVVTDVKDSISSKTIVVSIVTGKTHVEFDRMFGRRVKLMRTMPNTPAMVGEGMTALCPGTELQPDEVELMKRIFDSFGKSEVVPESMIEAVIGVAGSAPAYVFLFMEALADGAVAAGMPREMAYRFAAQTVLGSGKMLLESGMHPGALKDMVCSPGGTTIEAVRILERDGFRSAVMEAMAGCIEKAKKM